MAELVYAHDLKSCLARDVGSTPTSGTKIKTLIILISVFILVSLLYHAHRFEDF